MSYVNESIFLDSLISEANKYDWRGLWPCISGSGYAYDVGKRVKGDLRFSDRWKTYLKEPTMMSYDSPFFNRNVLNEIGKHHQICRVLFGNSTKRSQSRLALFGDEDDSRLPVSFSGVRNTGEKIVIALQCPFDYSLEEWRPYVWASQMIFVLRKIHGYTNPIVVAKHPGVKYNKLYDKEDLTTLGVLQETVELADNVTITENGIAEHLDDALFTVVLSSGSAIDSVLKGVPVYAHSPDCFMYESCFKDLSNPTWNSELILSDLINLSWSQWSHDEIPVCMERLHRYWELNINKISD